MRFQGIYSLPILIIASLYSSTAEARAYCRLKSRTGGRNVNHDMNVPDNPYGPSSNSDRLTDDQLDQELGADRDIYQIEVKAENSDLTIYLFTSPFYGKVWFRYCPEGRTCTFNVPSSMEAAKSAICQREYRIPPRDYGGVDQITDPKIPTAGFAQEFWNVLYEGLRSGNRHIKHHHTRVSWDTLYGERDRKGLLNLPALAYKDFIGIHTRFQARPKGAGWTRQVRVHLYLKPEIRDAEFVLSPYGDPEVDVWVPDKRENWVDREMRRKLKSKLKSSFTEDVVMESLRGAILDAVAREYCVEDGELMTGAEFDSCRESNGFAVDAILRGKEVINVGHLATNGLLNNEEYNELSGTSLRRRPYTNGFPSEGYAPVIFLHHNRD